MHTCMCHPYISVGRSTSRCKYCYVICIAVMTVWAGHRHPGCHQPLTDPVPSVCSLFQNICNSALDWTLFGFTKKLPVPLLFRMSSWIFVMAFACFIMNPVSLTEGEDKKEYKGPAVFGLLYAGRHSSVQANTELRCLLWYGIWADLS